MSENDDTSDIEPLNLGRKVADLTDTEPKSNLVDTKEEWDNRTLANLIRELACLGRHASDIFEALTYEAKILETRTQVLGQKTRKIQSKVEVSIPNLQFLEKVTHDILICRKDI